VVVRASLRSGRLIPGALVPVGLSLAFSTLAHTTQSVRVDASDDIMGTTFSVVLYDSNRVKGEAAANIAFAEAHRLDHVLSNYLPSSELSRVNREAARAPVKVSAELFSFLETALRYSRESEGAFDMTVGPLMKVWGFYKGEGLLPKPADVTGALKRVGYRHVILDGSERTVRFDAPDRARSRRDRKDTPSTAWWPCCARLACRARDFGGREQHLRDGDTAGRAKRVEDVHPRADRRAPHGRGRLSEERVDLNLGRLREVLSCRGQGLRAHHGPEDRLSRAGDRGRFGDCGQDDRQRGVGQAVLHQRPGVDRAAQGPVISRILLSLDFARDGPLDPTPMLMDCTMKTRLALALAVSLVTGVAAQDFAALKVELVAEGFPGGEGPVWSREGYLLFSDYSRDRIYKRARTDP
jgi:hypothetical protein